MEVEAETLPHIIFSWKANLQQTWRPESYQRLRWHHTDYHLIL